MRGLALLVLVCSVYGQLTIACAGALRQESGGSVHGSADGDAASVGLAGGGRGAGVSGHCGGVRGKAMAKESCIGEGLHSVERE